MDALHGRLKKKLDGNYTRMMQAILNKSWRQQTTKQQQLYGPLPPITKPIKVRRTRHAEHWWKSRNKLISDVLLWTPSHGRARAERPAWTYIQQLCADMRYIPEDQPEAMDDGERWRDRVRDIRADSVTCCCCWWWCTHASVSSMHAYKQLFRTSSSSSSSSLSSLLDCIVSHDYLFISVTIRHHSC